MYEDRIQNKLYDIRYKMNIDFNLKLYQKDIDDGNNILMKIYCFMFSFFSIIHISINTKTINTK